MVEFTYVITDEQGLHARPASQFVMAAAKCKSTVSVTFGSRTVNAKGVMEVMSLGAKKGQEILIKVEGENEAEDAANLKAFVQEHL